MNIKFQEKILAFELANNSLKAALDKQLASGSVNDAEVKKRHEAEIIELTRKATEKYQDMVLQQLSLQEEIKSEGERALVKAKEEVMRLMKLEMEKEAGRMKAESDGLREETLMKLRREYEDKLQQQRDEFSAKIERLSGDGKVKTDEFERLIGEKDNLVRSLEQTVDQLTQDLAKEGVGSGEKLTKVMKELADSKDDNATLRARVTERDEEIERLKRLLADKNSSLVELERSMKIANDEIQRLRGDLEKAQKSGSSLESELRTKLQTAENEASSLRNEINKIAAQLAGVRDELKRSENNALRSSQEHEKTNMTLKLERDGLNKQLQELLNVNQNKDEKANMEISTLKKQMLQRDEAFKTEKAELEGAHKKAISSLSDRHTTEVETMKREMSDASQLVSKNLATLTADLGQVQARLVAREKELALEHEAKLTQAVDKYETDISALKVSIKTLETQIEALSAASDGDKQKLKGEISTLESKSKALKQEIDAKKKDLDKAESVSTGLKNQVESLREELKAAHKAYLEKMEQSMAKQESDWQKKFDLQIGKDNAALKAAVDATLSEAKKQQDELRIQLQDELAVLKKALESEVG